MQENENTIQENTMQESENTGVIYMITNVTNGKKYVGQALSYTYHKGKPKKHGFEGRFKFHKKEASKGSETCTKLYAAMRKHGTDKFICELLEVCEISKVYERETFYIEKCKTIKDGYNIVLSYNHLKDHENNNGKEKRLTKLEKMKLNGIERNKKDPTYIKKLTEASIEAANKKYLDGEKESGLPVNISKRKNGYDICILRNGVHKSTTLVDAKLSDEEKLDKAIKIRDDLLKKMENNEEPDWHIKKLDHNENPLPQNIHVHKARGNLGYQVCIRKNNKSYEKSFTDSDKTMDEKLELAKKALDEMQESFDDLYETRKDRVDKMQMNRMDYDDITPLPKGVHRHSKSGSPGYFATIYNKGKVKTKRITDSDLTLEEKLNKIKEWLKDNQN